MEVRISVAVAGPPARVEVGHAAGGRQVAEIHAGDAEIIAAEFLIDGRRREDLIRPGEAPVAVDHESRAQRISRADCGCDHAPVLRLAVAAAENISENGRLLDVVGLVSEAAGKPQLRAGIPVELGIDLMQPVRDRSVDVVVVGNRRPGCEIGSGTSATSFCAIGTDASRGDDVAGERSPAGCRPGCRSWGS